MVVGLVAVAGCRLLENAEVAPTTDPGPPVVVQNVERPVAEVDPSLVDDFRRWLDQDAWQVDLAWNVTSLQGPCPSRPWRWIFRPGDGNPATDGKPTPSSPAADRWAWVFRGDAAMASEDDRQAAVAALNACRADTGRLGLHAAILLSRLPTEAATDEALREVCESGGATAQVIRAGAGIESAPTTKVEAVRYSVNTRCAAAEAWCARLAAKGVSPDTALSPAGRLLQTPGLPDELRGTLWRSLSQWLPPDRLPGLAETCAGLDQRVGQSAVLQRAALEACIIAASQHRGESPAEFVAELWPQHMERARRHSDPGLRKLYGRWLALSGHPETLTVLTAQQRDTDPFVRVAAIHSLGLSGQPQAREQLEHIAHHDGERDRATAVEALSQWGATAIEPFVSAKSAAVRTAIAKGLTSRPDPQADRLLRMLLRDPHPDVQSAALQTARQWPAEWAIPALLEALRGSQLSVRQDAALALREMTHEDVPVPIDGLPEARDEAVRQWAATHGWRVGQALTEALIATESLSDRSQIIAALEECLQAASLKTEAWDRLLNQTRPEDVPLIERTLLDSASPVAEAVRRELLPRLDDAYAALRDLSDADVQRRRDAAGRLLTVSRKRTLSPALVRSLRSVLLIEQDQLVWQRCLEAVQADGHDEAMQLALLAVHHSWPDVRRLGVTHIALHPTPEAAGWLMPLFRDDNRGVQHAAIAAAAHCGNPTVLDGYPAAESAGVTGLRPLLGSSDHELRWVVLQTMATLRDDQAAAELMRLSYDSHPKVREQAARVMGTTGDSRFVESLVRWSWTESADAVKQAILASLETLTPAEERPETPSGLAAPLTIDDKIKQWAAWWERHAPHTGAAPRPNAAPES